MKQTADKINLVETPKSWDDIVKFCERASTPSDAAIAALMAWNYCVDWHAENDSCCDQLRKLKEQTEQAKRTEQTTEQTTDTQTSKLDVDSVISTEDNNDGC